MGFLRRINKFHIATFIALLFHVSGCIGMFSANRQWFINNTPLNLLIMFGLILWTHPVKNSHFLLFVLIAFATGMITEMIGVHTGLLFGNYSYGAVMGAAVARVPLLIGVNWFVTMYCVAVATSSLHARYQAAWLQRGVQVPPAIIKAAFVIDGALLATLFDYLLEPVAIQFGYWQWLGSGSIPLYNYVCWFVISAGLMLVFRALNVSASNQFALHLLIIEMLFFGIISTFL